MSHLERTTWINAPLARVYQLAHDPKHWSDWYVGISEEKAIEGPGEREARLLMVGAPFPLTQHVLDDHLGRTEAHWRARVEGPPESVEVTRLCRLLMLAPECDWTYKARNGNTELTVTLDFDLPPEFAAEIGGETVERAEAECLELSLENLKRYCEDAH